MKDCIDYGLQHYATVRIAQYQVENATQQAPEALGQYLPQLSATGRAIKNIKL